MFALRDELGEDRGHGMSQADQFETLVKAIAETFGSTVTSERLMKRESLMLLEGLLDAIRIGEFTLSSGAKSDFYIDARTVTMNPVLMPHVGCAVLNRSEFLRAAAVGGPATAAIPMVAAAATIGAIAFSLDAGPKIKKAFYVRPEIKNHGTKTLIEGAAPSDGERVLLVDDVLTSGGSIIKAAQVVRDSCSAVIVGAMVLVDRQEGGSDALAREGIETYASYKKSELLPLKKAMEEMSREIGGKA